MKINIEKVSIPAVKAKVAEERHLTDSRPRKGWLKFREKYPNIVSQVRVRIPDSCKKD